MNKVGRPKKPYSEKLRHYTVRLRPEYYCWLKSKKNQREIIEALILKHWVNYGK